MTPEVKDRIIKERVLDVLESIIARQALIERVLVGQRGYSHDSRVITGLCESTNAALERLRIALDSQSDPPARALARRARLEIPIHEPHELGALSLPPVPTEASPKEAVRPSLRVIVNSTGWIGKASAVLAALMGVLALLKTMLDSFR